jgi:hypothetical protein
MIVLEQVKYNYLLKTSFLTRNFQSQIIRHSQHLTFQANYQQYPKSFLNLKALKVQWYETFDLWFFSLNNPIWAPDSRIKAFSTMASNSRSYSKKSVPEWCQWHCWGRGPRIREALAAFKGNFYKKYIGKLYYPIAITITQKILYRGYLRIVFGMSGVIDTAQAKIGDFKVEYLREFQAICKKTLNRVSGA